MKYISKSIGKFEKNTVNEDAAFASKALIAVSDGAGGGGVYAEFWSQYLLNNLPKKPITSFDELDTWLDQNWEQFYNKYEEKAKLQGGMFLNKFYDEGSYATLAAAWKTENNQWYWMTYGDSVVFSYNFKTGVLQHSPIKLKEFNNPPFLISSMNPLQEEGVKHGKFSKSEDTTLFIASDALSHYILMMYKVVHKDKFEEELSDAIDSKSKNSSFIKTALHLRKIDFYKNVMLKLINSCQIEINFKRHLGSLESRGLLAKDDYSLTMII